MNSFTRTVLEYLAETGTAVLSSFFPRNYPESALARQLLGLDSIYRRRKPSRHTLSTILWRLKQEGLVERRVQQDRSVWKITLKGKNHLQRIPARTYHIEHPLPAEDGILRLVSFDIPEKDRKERRWLRRELIGYHFDQIHKSVYLGTRPLPQEFIEEIDTHNLAGYIHIVTIDKRGSLIRVLKT